METSSKPARRHYDSSEEDQNIKAAVHDEDKDHHHHCLYDNAMDRGGLKTTHTDEERHQEDNETADDEHQEVELETDNTLDYTIEYSLRGGYPTGLTKYKKKKVRKEEARWSVYSEKEEQGLYVDNFYIYTYANMY